MQDNATMNNTANPGTLTTTAADTRSDRQLRPRKNTLSYADDIGDTDSYSLEQHISAWSQYVQQQSAISQPARRPSGRQADSGEKNLWPAAIFFAPFSDSPTEVELRVA